MQIFEIGDLISILGMDPDKAKNWTTGKPFTIHASIRKATGKGSRNLYSLGDLYLMGLANELSKAGMAGNAIGKFVEAAQRVDLGKLNAVTFWRPTGKLSFVVVEGAVPPPPEVTLWQTVRLGDLIHRINREADRAAGTRLRKR